MKRTLLLASSAAIIGLVLAAPVWARGFGGGGYGGGRGGYGGGGRGGYGGGGYHGGEMGGRGGYGGYHGGEEGHGNYSDGFHGGEEGYHGGYGGNGQHPGSFGGQSPTAGNFGSQAAGHNLSNVNPSNLSNLQGAGKNLNPNNLNPSNFNGSHLQQQQPWNNWYQGHGNWGNTNTAGNWAGSGLGAAAGLGAADLGAAAAAVPGWGMGSAYYDSGYGSYSNPYYSGDDGSSGYDYSQPVQAVQYTRLHRHLKATAVRQTGLKAPAPMAPQQAGPAPMAPQQAGPVETGPPPPMRRCDWRNGRDSRFATRITPEHSTPPRPLSSKCPAIPRCTSSALRRCLHSAITKRRLPPFIRSWPSGPVGTGRR